MPRHITECNFCECFSHAWSSTQRWGVVLVDAEDAHLLMNYIWTMKRDTRAFYARSQKDYQRLHQKVIPGRERVDHVDHNGLDCRRINLRDATAQQNSRNRVPSLGKRSIFQGVDWHKHDNKWRARIYVNGRRIELGQFRLEEDAALAYNFAAHEHFGEFARFNT